MTKLGYDATPKTLMRSKPREKLARPEEPHRRYAPNLHCWIVESKFHFSWRNAGSFPKRELGKISHRNPVAPFLFKTELFKNCFAALKRPFASKGRKIFGIMAI